MFIGFTARGARRSLWRNHQPLDAPGVHSRAGLKSRAALKGYLRGVLIFGLAIASLSLVAYERHRPSYLPLVSPWTEQLDAPPALDGLQTPFLSHYSQVPAHHPTPVVGSYSLLNLSEACYSYQQRYGIYENRSDLAHAAWPAGPAGPAPGQERLTAILLRSYEGFIWQEDDLINTRAMISELVSRTGGGYRLHVLVQIKSDDAIHDSPEAYDTWLNRTVPEELRPFATLWTEAMMTAAYPDLGPPVWGWSMTSGYRSCYMPDVWFALNHPVYEYFWNWELDARYTGDYHDLMTKVERFASREQWQPDMRTYRQWHIPAVSTWQTQLPAEQEGAEADYISFLPIFDPRGSGWQYENDLYGFENGTHQDRRASINTCNRVSRRLLLAMHKMHAVDKQLLFCEAMGPSTALLMGYKAVYAPVPVYFNTDLAPQTLDSRINDVRFYKHERRARTSTFYFNARHALQLYREWRRAPKKGWTICRKPVLLHPVKSLWLDHRFLWLPSYVGNLFNA